MISTLVMKHFCLVISQKHGKCILKENEAMQNRTPGTSLASQYKLFCQRHSLEQIIKHATRTTSSSYTLIDHLLTNYREKISQTGF